MTESKLIDDDVNVCIDCYMNHHEGRAMHDSSVGWTDNTIDEDDEETGITDFSSSPCQCCGSTLAGTRFRMATWEVTN